MGNPSMCVQFETDKGSYQIGEISTIYSKPYFNTCEEKCQKTVNCKYFQYQSQRQKCILYKDCDMNESAGTGTNTYKLVSKFESGCMDQVATNYNGNAMNDDGSCEYPELNCLVMGKMGNQGHQSYGVYHCTDNTACATGRETAHFNKHCKRITELDYVADYKPEGTLYMLYRNTKPGYETIIVGECRKSGNDNRASLYVFGTKHDAVSYATNDHAYQKEVMKGKYDYLSIKCGSNMITYKN